MLQLYKYKDSLGVTGSSYISAKELKDLDYASGGEGAAVYLHRLYRLSREGKSWEDLAWEETRKWLSNVQAAFAITAMEALNTGSSKITIEYDPNSKFDMIEKYGMHYELKNGFPTISNSVGSKVNPNEIRFSQSSVNGANELTTSMKSNGWQGDPIDVVEMPDGKLSTLDNTRVVAARQAGIDVMANVHGYNDPLPSNLVNRFTTPKGVPKTWGEALELRIGKQNATFRNTFPSGSFDLPEINN